MVTIHNNSQKSDTVAITQDTSAQAGVQKYLSGKPTVPLGGKDTAPATIVATLQADVDAIKAADAAKADYQKKVADKKAARAAARVTLKLLRNYVLGVMGADAQVFADFAFKLPASGGAKTVAAKAHGILQAEATRKLRGTKGPKARAKVKGVVAPVAEAPAALVAQTTPANVTK